jgi:hypothetical protein
MTTKHTIITVSLALIAFVFGCVTEAVVVHPVQAGPEAPPVRAGTNPTRWEYRCVGEGHDDVEAASNKLGAQGWELVAVASQPAFGGTDHRWCYKRPLP